MRKPKEWRKIAKKARHLIRSMERAFVDIEAEVSELKLENHRLRLERLENHNGIPNTLDIPTD